MTAAIGKTWWMRYGIQPRVAHCRSPRSAASSTWLMPAAARSSHASPTSARARPWPRAAPRLRDPPAEKGDQVAGRVVHRHVDEQRRIALEPAGGEQRERIEIVGG